MNWAAQRLRAEAAQFLHLADDLEAVKLSACLQAAGMGNNGYIVRVGCLDQKIILTHLPLCER